MKNNHIGKVYKCSVTDILPYEPNRTRIYDLCLKCRKSLSARSYTTVKILNHTRIYKDCEFKGV